MRRLSLNLELLDDIVASAASATEGGHESLDFLPGAMLLGAVAARLYPRVTPEQAVVLFHSGRVRFGDGLPLPPGAAEPARPLPLAWHERRASPARRDGRLLADRVLNLAQRSAPPGEQLRQLRSGQALPDGRVFEVAKSLRMKTALDPATGRVAEGQLFGYEALCAGQRFRAEVHADEDLPESLWQMVQQALLDPAGLLLGRSRSAEYGRVRVQARPDAPTAQAPQPDAGGELILWCQSDLALCDALGQPLLQPSAQALGLGAGAVDWARSFLRWRSYSPWNGHRQAPDLQRQVICRGSVIVLRLESDWSAEQADRLARGLGMWRECGLGQVLAQPAWLTRAQPEFAPIVVADPPQSDAAIARPADPLLDWLEEQQGAGASRQAAEQRARAWLQALVRCYRAARQYGGVASGLPIGPSPSQWGSVAAAARQAASLQALAQRLFDGDDAICKPSGEGWRDPFAHENAAGTTQFRDWLQDRMRSVSGGEGLEVLRLFARRAQDAARIERGQVKEPRMNRLDHHHMYLARFTLQARSALSVGSGADQGVFDHPLVRDANGLPTIPGTALTGVLRSLWAADRRPGLDDIFGFQRGSRGAASRLEVAACCLQDSQGRAVEGLCIEPAQRRHLQQDPLLAEALRGQEHPVLRDRVRLNHRGSVDGRGKFDRCVLPAGYRFSGELRLWSASPDDPAWPALLALLADPRLRLGGATRAGLGAVQPVAVHAARFDLRQPADVQCWRALGPAIDDLRGLQPVTPQAAAEAGESLHLRLQPQDFWRIGQGTDTLGRHGDKTPDLLPKTEPVVVWPGPGQPARFDLRRLLVPASSLKGMLAHRVAFHHMVLTGRFAEDFSDAERAEGDPVRADPAVIDLFGQAHGAGGGLAGRVFIDDLHLPVQADQIGLQMHNSIDRFSGGVRDRFLFSEELVWRQPIDLRLHLLPPRQRSASTPLAERALALALQDLCAGRLAIGAAQAKGHGRCTATPEGNTRRWLDERTGPLS